MGPTVSATAPRNNVIRNNCKCDTDTVRCLDTAISMPFDTRCGASVAYLRLVAARVDADQLAVDGPRVVGLQRPLEDGGETVGAAVQVLEVEQRHPHVQLLLVLPETERAEDDLTHPSDGMARPTTRQLVVRARSPIARASSTSADCHHPSPPKWHVNIMSLHFSA